jgi:putative phosphoesterase
MNTLATAQRIGVISGTHRPFRATRAPEAALRCFENVVAILRAGDLSTREVLEQLSAFAPLAAVRGNAETEEIMTTLPIKRAIVVAGCAIGLIHTLGEQAHYARHGRREFAQARVVVFGHSHFPLVEETAGLLLLNLGSATDRRRQPTCTVAILTIGEDGAPPARLYDLP